MNLIQRFKLFSALPFLSAVISPAVHAHPGHVADQSIHSLLHVEHIIALLAAGVIAFAVYALRDK
jgi:membrane protein DedA with SNARE-associated domain